MNNIYVDELPKRCNECKFQIFIAYHKNGWEHKERFCSVLKNNYDCICSKENCPLKPLTDRLAEGRKKVVQEIRDKFKENLIGWYYDEDNANKELYLDADCVWRVLDQIERGE